MNEGMNKLVKEWMNGGVKVWMNEWMSEEMTERLNELRNEWMNEWMNERTNEWRTGSVVSFVCSDKCSGLDIDWVTFWTLPAEKRRILGRSDVHTRRSVNFLLSDQVPIPNRHQLHQLRPCQLQTWKFQLRRHHGAKSRHQGQWCHSWHRKHGIRLRWPIREANDVALRNGTGIWLQGPLRLQRKTIRAAGSLLFRQGHY